MSMIVDDLLCLVRRKHMVCLISMPCELRLSLISGTVSNSYGREVSAKIVKVSIQQVTEFCGFVNHGQPMVGAPA
jgi:hypothetical protein